MKYKIEKGAVGYYIVKKDKKYIPTPLSKTLAELISSLLNERDKFERKLKKYEKKKT